MCLCVFQVFQTFVVSFNEQRRPVMPLLTAMKRTPQLSEEQRNLRGAWDALAEKVCSLLTLVILHTKSNHMMSCNII